MSAGDVTEDDVEGIRSGRIADPTVGQVAALAAVFGVPPSYLVHRGKDPSILDEELLGGPGRRDDGRDTQGERPPAGAREGDSPRHRPAVRGGTLGVGRQGEEIGVEVALT